MRLGNSQSTIVENAIAGSAEIAEAEIAEGVAAVESASTASYETARSSQPLVGQASDEQASNGLSSSEAVEQDEHPTQSQNISLPPPSEASMQDYYQLQQNLLGLTVAFGVVIFPFVWGFYSLQIALDYVLGACAGIVYLRMLGKNVSAIGRQKKNSSAGRLAIFAGVMIVSMRWDQLEVMPVFLGFLTYKAALIAFVLWTSVRPTSLRSQSSATSQINTPSQANTP